MDMPALDFQPVGPTVLRLDARDGAIRYSLFWIMQDEEWVIRAMVRGWDESEPEWVDAAKPQKAATLARALELVEQMQAGCEV